MKGLILVGIGTTGIIGGIIIKKLKDIHNEIIFIEENHCNIYRTRKEYYKELHSKNWAVIGSFFFFVSRKKHFTLWE